MSFAISHLTGHFLGISALLSLSTLLAVGCDSKVADDGTPGTTTAGGGGTGNSGGGGEGAMGGMSYGGEGSWIISTGSGSCNSTLYEPPALPGQHVEECSELEFISNPPTSGNHYGRWATFQIYDVPIPWGYVVHAMEHGAVVLAYNCEDCADEIAKMEAFVNSLEQDPACAPFLKRRVILLPAPDLDVPFAVAAWGFMLKADCFDEALVAKVAEEQYGKGPEDLCAPGFDPTDPDERIPSNCGD